MVVGGQFSTQRQVGHKEQREHETHGYGTTEHPAEQPDLREPTRRAEQGDNSDTEWNGACQHEGMAASPARVKPVRPLPHHGIGHRVHHQRQQRGNTRQASRQAQYLVVIEEQECAEGGLFHPVGQLPDAIAQPGNQFQGPYPDVDSNMPNLFAFALNRRETLSPG